jgi:hypothetical protein
MITYESSKILCLTRWSLTLLTAVQNSSSEMFPEHFPHVPLTYTRAFTADAPEKALNFVRTLDEKFKAVIEEDMTVWANKESA